LETPIRGFWDKQLTFDQAWALLSRAIALRMVRRFLAMAMKAAR